MKIRKWQTGILSCILAFCLCFSVPSGAVEAETENSTADRAVFDLIAYGIIPSDVDRTPQRQITRAEIADMVSRMLQLDEIENKQPMYFVDVEAENLYVDAINNVAQAGIIQGDEEGYFRPDDPVTLQEAAKIFACTLGYDYLAKDLGYPAGYMNVAMEIGLLDGINQSGAFYAEQVYIMAYNALDIDLMTKRVGTEEYYISKDDTLRARLTYDRDSTLYQGKGIVSANFYTYIDEPVGTIEEDQVMIAGRIYNCGETDAADFVGQEVDFYAREENGVWTLVNVKSSNRSYTLTITAEAMIETQGTEIRYEADGNERRAKVAEDFLYIYNNIPQVQYSAEDLRSDNGELILVYNDGDSLADIVFRNEYEYVRIDSVVNNRFYFADNASIGGQISLSIDFEDPEIKYILQDAQ